jgi:glycosyltransferase involved in cell wall biosynthesis
MGRLAGAGPLVSVIIPTYNCGRYITEAVESALAQRDVTVEVIVVDDGSTDDTAARLAPYRGRVQHFIQDNAGPGAARAVGQRAGRGEYLAFLDADDRWRPDKLALQVAYLRAHPDVGLVCSDFGAFTDAGPVADSYIATYSPVVRGRRRRFDQIYPIHETFEFAGREIPSYRGDVFARMLEGYFTLTSTVVMRRSCMDTCGTFSAERWLVPAEDQEYYLRIARRYSIAYLDVPTAWYRLREGQLSRVGGGVHTLKVWLALAERVRCEDPEFFAAHRALVKRVIRQHALGLAWTLYARGAYRAAAAVFLHSLRVDPWQKRAYVMLVLAWLRSFRPGHRAPTGTT